MSDNSTSLIRNPGKADSPTVRGSEGAGTTVLTRTDSFWQIFNLSAARTVLLPSVGVKAGDQIRLDLRSLFTLTVQAANASQIAAMSSLGSGTWVALIDSPATSTDWLFAGGTSPAAMDDASATRLGLKVYSHGTTYNGGNAPTITLTVASGLGGVVSAFIPYQVQDGSWRLKANVLYTFTSNGVADINVAGVNAVNEHALAVSGAGSNPVHNAYVAAPNQFVMRFGSVVTSNRFHCDIPLSSKPTWAY